MKTTRLLLTIVVVVLIATMASGTTYYVNQDGTGDFEGIRDAIDAAACGDKILVAPGTYPGGIDFKGKAITVTSAEGPEVTIIDGNRNRGVLFDSGEAESSVLSGFTITNCYAHDDGGGILCRRSCPTIRDNLIAGNSTGGPIEDYYGGGIFCDNASPVIVNNIIFDNGTGGIKWGCGYGGGIACLDSSPLILNNLIVANGAGLGLSPQSGAFDDGRGGAIYSERSCPTIMFCTFQGNFTRGQENLGGLHFEGGSVATIANCIIVGTSNTFGVAHFSYCCFEGEARPASGNIGADPLFASGRLGEYYLSAVAAGQEADSPCIDAGMGAPPDYGLDGYTTRTDDVPDVGVADMGYHYPTQDALDDVTIGCSLNEYEFAPGDLMQGYLLANNRGGSVMVNIHIAFLMPDGSIYSLTSDGLQSGTGPWLTNVMLPPGLVGPMKAFEFAVPASAKAGPYWYIAALARSDSPFVFISTDMSHFGITGSTGLPDSYVDAQLGDDYNDGSENKPWRTITRALKSVEGSEATPVTIHVAAGIYSASTNGETFPLIMEDWVSISGVDRESTILDARSAAYHVIYCDGADHLTIEGLTITGGYANGSESDKKGAGIYCTNSSPTIRDNIIAENVGVEGEGGGIYCYQSSPAIEGNQITNNRQDRAEISGNGGGISCEESSPVITNNNISNNSAGNGAGGIRCASNSSPIIEYNIIAGNTARDDGGGILCGDCAPTIRSNTISGNTAENTGGGVRCRRASPRIENNTITDNTATDGGGVFCQEDSSPVVEGNAIEGNHASNDGGGVCCWDNSSPTLKGNLIAGNEADDNGGGIYCCDGSAPIIRDNGIADNEAHTGGGISCCDNSPPTIENNWITSNWAGGGGGVYCDAGSSPIIRCNTIVDNSGGHYGDAIACDNESSPLVVDCIIRGWGSGQGDALHGCSVSYCCIEDPDGGEGNIRDDPMFVSGPLGDYYLDPDSPCIDAGSRSAEEAGLSERTTQVDGTLDTGTLDMGFHYPIQ